MHYGTFEKVPLPVSRKNQIGYNNGLPRTVGNGYSILQDQTILTYRFKWLWILNKCQWILVVGITTQTLLTILLSIDHSSRCKLKVNTINHTKEKPYKTDWYFPQITKAIIIVKRVRTFRVRMSTITSFTPIQNLKSFFKMRDLKTGTSWLISRRNRLKSLTLYLLACLSFSLITKTKQNKYKTKTNKQKTQPKKQNQKNPWHKLSSWVFWSQILLMKPSNVLLIYSNTKNAKFRIPRSQVCFLRITHSCPLKPQIQMYGKRDIYY